MRFVKFFLVIILFSNKVFAQVVTNGLVLYVDARNPSSYSGSGNTWNDLSGLGNNGSILNGTFFDSQDKSFLFDGTNDKIITPSISNIYSYTIEVVTKGGNGTLIYRNSNMNYSDNNDNLTLKISNSNNNVEFRIEYNATDNDKNLVVNNNFSQDKFYHIVVSYDWNSKTQKVYIDGVLKGTSQHSSEPSNIYRADSFYSIGTVGYSNHGGGNSDRDMFSGKISKVLIYNSALSDQQVLQNYNALVDFPPTDISLTSNTISETASVGTIVGTLSATDSDTSISSLTFSFTSSGDAQDDDNGSFTISGTSLLTSTTLDYETKTSYNIYVNVNDGTSNYAKAFTVSVTNINEPPIDLSFEAAASFFEYLVVGGGGAGGYGNSNEGGGGGGAGGYLTGTLSSTSGTTYTITVGAGGTGVNSTSSPGGNGGSSSIAGQGITTVTALGGGGGGGCSTSGATGASGGGGSGCGTDRAGASGTAGHSNSGGKGRWINNSPGQGNGGGGGGSSSAGARGQDRNRGTLGGGGAGTSNDISGSSVTYAAGGDGGPGGPNRTFAASNETGNTGNGGDGGTNRIGGNGAKGIVVLRYLGNPIATGGTITQNGGHTIHSFTQTGNSNFTISSGGTSTSTASFDEGSAVGTLVATLTATDTDTTNLTYSLATGNGTNDQHNSLFTVSGTQLLVASSTISYDNLTSLNVNLQVSDGEHVIRKAFQISVNDLNRAPTDIGLTSNTISENVSATSVVGILSAVDSDTSDTHSYTLANSGDAQDDDNDSFTISGTSLIINSSPDYETKASYNIYINVNDGANDFAKAFTVSVTNVLEPITDLGFSSELNLEYLIVAGGGGGGYRHGSGGGAGGLLSGSFKGLQNSTYNVSVGAGGAGGTNSTYNGSNGSNSQLSGGGLETKTAIGGGGGVSYDASGGLGLGQGTGSNGGSGGGASYRNGVNGNGGTATAGQGNNGGNIISSSGQYNHAGGGGAGSAGGNASSNRRGDGGDGIQSSITGTATYYAGGGGGGSHNPVPSAGGGAGGQGGGGAGGTAGQNSPGVSGTANTGGGGGGASTPGGGNQNGGSGGSGIVIVRYLGTPIATGGTITQNGGYTIHSFTQVGNSNLTFQSASGTGTSTTSVDEEVAVGTLVANLTATDSDTTSFTFSLVSGNGSNDRNNSSFTISGTQLLVGGNIDYETTPSLNIYVQASDGTNTFSKALTVNVNDINEPPTISSSSIASDNTSVSVIFSEAVFGGTAQSTATLAANDFSLALTGGTATLSSTTPSSISVNGTTVQLGLPLSGTPNGSEVITISPVSNAIFDVQGLTASSTQSNNTVNANADSDGDGITDPLDLCSGTPQGATVDSEGCAESQKDPDNDGVFAANDNCPTVANPDQADNDQDGVGNVCDNCVNQNNPFQVDTDADGYGDVCDEFPNDASENADSDGDGIGDNADTDDDNDNWSDTIELACGTSPTDSADKPIDSDNDGDPDCLDPDDDNDGYLDTEDLFPFDNQEWADNDLDGIGDNADTDDDNDQYLDQDEIDCLTDPFDRTSTPDDFDKDLIPDCIDPNDDNDSCPDTEDEFPLDPEFCQDTDGDGIDDRFDFDSDNDGIPDHRDQFPQDPNASADSDGDGIPDSQDTDKNNDGFPDDQIIVSSALTPNQPGVEATWKVINVEDYPFTSVRVYAADGSTVFQSENYQNEWTGTNIRTGSALPTGPYYYRIELGGTSGEIIDGWLYIFN